MSARLPRIVVIGLVAVLATAGLTYGAEQKLVSSPTPTASAPLVQQRTVLTVPDVRNQAFVFAKGALQDAGFAWRVAGRVRGYSANRVVSQTPAPGTRVYDTGAPIVTLSLVRNSRYPQQGKPEDVSPYHGTATEVAEAATQPISPAPSATTTTATPTTPAVTPTAPATPVTPTVTTPGTSYGASKAPATHLAAPAPAAKPTPATKPAAAKPAAPRYPQSRPPAFVVAGAPKEPLDEMPLDARALALDRWLTAHPKPSDALVKHWLYQNEWIVTGARFGWWHGAQALTTLIGVDRRAEALWGIGAKSEAVARGALAEVRARSK
jgi:hypothetical protein